MHLGIATRRLCTGAALGLAGLAGWSGPAMAAGPPTPSRLRAIGSSVSAERTRPFTGLGAAPLTQPLIVVSFVSDRVTTRDTPLAGHRSVRVRWFGGMDCTTTRVGPL